MGHILSLFTYLLATSVSGRVPVVLPDGYTPTGIRVINYPDTAYYPDTAAVNVDYEPHCISEL